MNATELPITTRFLPVRSNKVLFGTYLGFLVFRNRLGQIFNLATEAIMTLVTPLTGATITATPLVSDETTYVTPAGTIAAMTFTLPSAANARVGQVRRLVSSQIVTALTVNVNASGTLAGASLTAAAANVPYAWQLVSVTGTVATWLRIQ